MYNGSKNGRAQKLNFQLIAIENGEEVIVGDIIANSVEKVHEIARRKYGINYREYIIKIELGPPEEFDYAVHWATEDDYFGAPSREQISNAETDAQYEHREREQKIHDRATKCEDCGVPVSYKTRPFKRCAECKRKFEKERVHRARIKK